MDELLTDLADREWLFNNCYQVDRDLWRVNLRRPDSNGDWFTDWAEAPTFAEAIAECMSKLNEAEFTSTPASFAIAEPNQPSLLSRLNLHRTQPPIVRRI